MLSAWKC